MTTIFKNIVTVRKERGDVLSPVEYRSILEAIRAIIKKYNFSGLNRDYRALLAHLLDFDNPHHDDGTSFFEEIVIKTHSIYTKMTANPVTLAVFRTDIVPNLKFLELIRRIVLNRFLYDQVKDDQGAVPYAATVYVSPEWQTGVPIGPTYVIFGYNIASEIDFLKVGWSGNTSPVALIFNADNLYVPSKNLPIVYETNSETYDANDEALMIGSPNPLPLGTNDLTIQFQVMARPLTETALFTLRSASDTLSVRVDVDKSISVINNGNVVLKSDANMSDGKVDLIISSARKLALRIERLGVVNFRNTPFGFNDKSLFTTISLGVKHEDLRAGSFGLRSLVVFHGLTYLIP